MLRASQIMSKNNELNKSFIQSVIDIYECKYDEAVAYLKSDGNDSFTFKNGRVALPITLLKQKS